MDSVKITLEIFERVEKSINLGYDMLYINVDNLENGNGFLRVLAMQGAKDMIVFQGTFSLEVCFQVLALIKKSEYDITDFTTRR